MEEIFISKMIKKDKKSLIATGLIADKPKEKYTRLVNDKIDNSANRISVWERGVSFSLRYSPFDIRVNASLNAAIVIKTSFLDVVR